jgi:hypothetical protein
MSSEHVLGVATEDIGIDAEGYVTVFGQVRGLDTSGYAVGASLWLDPLNPGDFTDVQPEEIHIHVGHVLIQDISAGIILVDLDTEHDLYAPGATGDWGLPTPTTVTDALDRLASAVRSGETGPIA